MNEIVTIIAPTTFVSVVTLVLAGITALFIPKRFVTARSICAGIAVLACFAPVVHLMAVVSLWGMYLVMSAIGVI